MKFFGIIVAAATLTAMILILYILRYGQIPYMGGSSFHASFESGKLDPSRWQFDADADCHMQVVKSPGNRDGMSLLIDAKKGSRCEILPRIRTNILGKLGYEPRGVFLSYAFSIFIPNGQHFGERNEVLAQWHSDPDTLLGDTKARGPAVALRILAGTVGISSGWDDNFISTPGRKDKPIWSEKLVFGRWVDWRFEVIWSYTNSGRLKVWKDTALVIDRKGPNAYNDLRNVYLKLGIYHPSRDRQVYFDDFKFEER